MTDLSSPYMGLSLTLSHLTHWGILVDVATPGGVLQNTRQHSVSFSAFTLLLNIAKYKQYTKIIPMNSFNT